MRRILLLILCIVVHLSPVFSQSSDETPALRELIEKHAPVIRHHILESNLPSSVEWFMERSVLAKKRALVYFPFFNEWVYSDESDVICDLRYGSCRAQLSNQAKATGNSLEDRRWFMHPKSSAVRNGDLNSAEAYVHVKISHYQEYPRFDYDIEIQYWFFWPFNGATDPLKRWSDHEGDWEGVSVTLDSKGNLRYIATTSHGDRNFYYPGEIEYDEGHPVIYAAKKSHALYNRNGSFNAGFDDTWGVKGVKELKAWDAYKVVTIDPRIMNSGVTPGENLGWMDYGGRWGSTFSKDIIDFNFGFGSIEETTSNSPQFVMYDKLEWEGRFCDQIDFHGIPFCPLPNDYLFPEGTNEPNQISGPNRLCAGSTYTYSVGISKPKTVRWTAPNNFTPSEIQANTFRTKAGGTGTKKITANVTLDHKMTLNSGEVPVTVFQTVHNFSKNVTTTSPSSNSFSLNINDIGLYNNTSCITSVTLNNPTGAPISVTWSTTGGHSIQSSNTLHANIISPKGSYGFVEARITTCNQTFTVRELFNANCNSGSGFEGGGTGGGETGGGGTGGGGTGGGGNIGDPRLIRAVHLYPNPTSGNFRVSIPNENKTLQNVLIVLSDQSGKTVEEIEISKLKNSFVDIDVTNQKNGLYIINVFSNDRQLFKGKLLKN